MHDTDEITLADTASDFYSFINNESNRKKEGVQTDKNIDYHGLTEECVTVENNNENIDEVEFKATDSNEEIAVILRMCSLVHSSCEEWSTRSILLDNRKSAG